MRLDELFDYKSRLNELLAECDLKSRFKIILSYQNQKDYYAQDEYFENLDEFYSVIKDFVKNDFDKYKVFLNTADYTIQSEDNKRACLYFADPSDGTIFSFRILIDIIKID